MIVFEKYGILEYSTRLYPGPARKSAFVNAAIQISVSDFILIKQPSASVSPHLTALKGFWVQTLFKLRF